MNPATSRPRILLIDSNVYFSKRVGEALRQQGFDVIPCTQGTYALTMLEWNAPTAILCATNLREMVNVVMGPKGAKVILAARSTVSCVVRNLTNQGALLQLPSTRNLTAEFDLSFDKGRTLRKSHVVWRTFTKIGVSFDQLMRGRG